MKWFIFIAYFIFVAIAVTHTIQLEKTITAQEARIEVLSDSLSYEKARNERATADLKRRHVTQMRDVLKNAHYIGTVEKIKNDILLMPIESLLDIDISAVVSDSLIDLPINSPFKSGFRTTAHFGDDVLEGYWRKHKGVDLIPLSGDTGVYPTAPGVIIEIGHNEIYGKYVIIEHGEYRTFYGHLDKIYWIDIPNRKVVGEEVTPETKIGIYGNTGKTVPIIGDGRHLHYEVQWHDQVEDTHISINPLEFLNAGIELSKEVKEKEDDSNQV